MHEFSVVKVEDLNTITVVYKLVRNGKCKLDDFITAIEKDKNLSPELGDLYAILEDVANYSGILPANRYKKLHLSKNLSYAGFEAKSKHLRLYLFHDNDTGQIIAFGGKKGDQDEDIKRFEKTIKEYSEFKKLAKK